MAFLQKIDFRRIFKSSIILLLAAVGMVSILGTNQGGPVLCPSGTNQECFEADCTGADGNAGPGDPCWCTHQRNKVPIAKDQYFCAPEAEHQAHEC